MTQIGGSVEKKNLEQKIKYYKANCLAISIYLWLKNRCKGKVSFYIYQGDIHFVYVNKDINKIIMIRNYKDSKVFNIDPFIKVFYTAQVFPKDLDRFQKCFTLGFKGLLDYAHQKK